MRGIQAFIFDLDGTLIDNTPFHLQSWVQLFEEVGVELDVGEFQKWFNGKTTTQILRQVIGKDIPPAEISRLTERKEAIYRQLYGPQLKPLPGAVQFLKAAQQMNMPMAVATSAYKANVDFVLDGLNLRPYFKVITSAEDIRQGKPSPEIYLITASRLGIAPQACLVFEDSLAGIEAAERAGMRLIVITTSLGAEQLKHLPSVQGVMRDFTGLSPEAVLARETPGYNTR